MKPWLHPVFCFLVLAGVLWLPAQALAQERSGSAYRPYQPYYDTPLPDENYMANPVYRSLARTLLEDNPPGFDFMNLRAQYMQTRHYDPLGDEALKKMLDLAYVVQTGDHSQKAVDALAAYEQVLQDHISHIAVVSQAIALARQDPRFGNIKLLERIRTGLFESVIKSGDGLTLQRAYGVVTMAEETMLLQQLDYEVLTTRPAHSGVLYYNMHYVIERATQKPYTIFVNITFPMRHLERKRREQGRSVNVRRR